MAQMSEMVENALLRVQSQSGNGFAKGADAISALSNIANVDVSDVTYAKGDEYVFPATAEEWEKCQFSRVFNGKPTAGFALATKDGKGSKIIYYTTLRKILIPCTGTVESGFKLNSSDIKHSAKNVYKDVMALPNMSKVYEFIRDNKLGKSLKVEDIKTETIAVYEGKEIVGTREGKLPEFVW